MLEACKKCRREGVKLILKGERCLSPKCAFTRRSYAPGDHGQGSFSKTSEYGKQLREKQKAKRIYGIIESQFSRYAKTVNKMVGNKSENLMRFLELRLDNIAYRMGLAESRSHARQLVSHGLVTVNGKKVTIPSYRVSEGDVIAPKTAGNFKDRSLNSSITWIQVDNKKVSCKISHLPIRDEIDTPINESLVIEYYSR